MNITEEIERHLRQLAPHAAQRESAQLLRAAAAEIERMTITASVRQHVDKWLYRYKDTHDLYLNVTNIVDRALIEATLKHTRGNQSRAAEVLGINRNTLRKMMRKLKGYATK